MTALQNQRVSHEEPEGLERTDGSLGDYPIDSLLIRTENCTVFDVVRGMNAK
jgi:hypothetical protein